MVNITAMASKTQTTKRRRRVWSRFVRVLAMVVVFCTTYALILPAITMEKSTVCGLEEHAHNEQCYQAVECALTEAEGHVHSEADCVTYDEQVLVCEQDEHTHIYACYPAESRDYTYTDETVHVSVVLPEDSAVPEDAVLKVAAIESDAEGYDALVEQAEDTVDGEVKNIALYDISFYTADDEYIPVDDAAQVSLRFVEAPVDAASDVVVLHYDDEDSNPQILEEVTVAEQPAEETLPVFTATQTVLTFQTKGFSTFAVVEVTTKKIDITGKTFDMINVNQNNLLDERIVMIATADAFGGKYYAMTSNAKDGKLEAVEVVRNDYTVTVPADSYNAFAFKFIANETTADVPNDYFIQSLATGKYLALNQNNNDVTLSDEMTAYQVATATNETGGNFNWISMITTKDTVQGEVQPGVERETQGRELAYDNVNGCFTTYGNSIDGDTNVNRAKMVLVDINGVIETDVIPVDQAVAEGGDPHPLDGKIIAINSVYGNKTRSFTHTFVDDATQAGENLRGMTAEADVNGNKYTVSETALWKFIAVDGKPNIYKIAAYDYTTEKVGKYLNWAGNNEYMNLTDEAGADEIKVGENGTEGYVDLRRLTEDGTDGRYLAYNVDADLIVSYSNNDEQDNFVLSEVAREEVEANEVIEGLGNRYYMILGVNLNNSDAAVRLMHEPVEGGFLGEVVDDFGKNGNNLTEKDFNDYTNATWFFEPAGEGTYFIRTATFEDGAEQATLGDYINISADGLTLSKAKQAIEVVKADVEAGDDTNAVCLRVDVNKQVLRYEAEDAQLAGIADPVVPSPGSGGGHLGNIGGDPNNANDVHGTATFTVNSNTNANALLTICYAQAEVRPVYVSVNGEDVATTGFGFTGGWTNFSGRVTVPVTLNAGDNTVVLSNPNGYGPNIDYIEVAFQELGTSKYEMEDGVLYGVANIPNGKAYVGNVGNGNAGTVTHTVTMPAAATATLRLSYATANARNVEITVNGEDPVSVECAATGGWEVFGTIDIEGIPLQAGENTIIFGNAAGYAPNLDSFELIVGNAPSYQYVNLHGNNLDGYFGRWDNDTGDEGNHLVLAEFQKVDDTLDELDELLAGLVVDGDGYAFSDKATPGSAGPLSTNDNENQGLNDDSFPDKYDAAVEYRARMQELARKLYKIYQQDYDATTGEWTDIERSYLLSAIEAITGKTVEDFMADIKWLANTIKPIQAALPNVKVQLFNYDNTLVDTKLWAGGFTFYHQGGVHNPHTAVDGTGDSSNTIGRDDETMYMSSFLTDDAPVITYGNGADMNLSMSEVFGNNSQYEVTKEKGAMLGGGGLFLFDESSNMYYYHADRNAATYDPEANYFKLYDAVIRPMYINGGDQNNDKAMRVQDEANGSANTEKFDNSTLRNDGRADYAYVNSFGERVPLNPADRYNFLPFNDAENIIFDKNGMHSTTSHDGESVPIATSGYLNEQADMWFGMKIETDFFQPNDGMVENYDEETARTHKDQMKFKFYGDDDVFVYINGILVLDIGGTHGSSGGEINFATGEVTYEVDEQDKGPDDNFPDDVNMNIRDLLIERVVNGVSGKANAAEYLTIDQIEEDPDQLNAALATLKNDYEIEFQMVNGKWILKEFKHYNFKFYYMERGGNVSYNGIEFNLLAMPEDSLTLKKEFDLEGAIDSGKTFTYKVLKAVANKQRYEMENGTTGPNVTKVANPDASGGVYVGNVKGTNGVTYNINSTKDCQATLIIHYGTAAARKLAVTVNDDDPYEVDCYSSGAWDAMTNTTALTIDLKQGQNTIVFSGVDNGDAPNLDYFEIQTDTVPDTGVIDGTLTRSMLEGTKTTSFDDDNNVIPRDSDGYVSFIRGASATVTHTVNAEKAGLAELKITYASKEDRDIRVVVNGDTANAYEITGWATSADNWTTQKTVVLYVELKEGENTLTFGGRIADGTEYYAPNLYSFELSSADQNFFESGTKYSVINPISGRMETRYVTPEGYIYLKGGEQAIFENIFDGYTDELPDYVVQEVLESGEYGQYSVQYKVTGVELGKEITTPISGNDSGIRYTYHYQTAVVDTGDYTTSVVDYINSIEKPVGALKVSKVLDVAEENKDAYAETDFTFTLEVCNIPVGEGDSVEEKNEYLNANFHTVPDGTAYTLWDADGNVIPYLDAEGKEQTIRYTKDGKFSMRADQYVTFEGFVAGTYFRVKEVDTDGKIFRITYYAEVHTSFPVERPENYVSQAGETASSGWGMFGRDGSLVAVEVTNADALCDASVGVRKLISNWAGADTFTVEPKPIELYAEMEPVVDVDGNPVLDENNNPLMKETGRTLYRTTDLTEGNVTIMTAADAVNNESTGSATKIITFNRSAIDAAYAAKTSSTTKYFRFRENATSTAGNKYVYDSTEYIVEVTLSTDATDEEVAKWTFDQWSVSEWTAKVTNVWKVVDGVVDKTTSIADAYDDPNQDENPDTALPDEVWDLQFTNHRYTQVTLRKVLSDGSTAKKFIFNVAVTTDDANDPNHNAAFDLTILAENTNATGLVNNVYLTGVTEAEGKDTNIADGTFVAKLGHNEFVTFWVPYGSKVVVTESDTDGYSVEYKVTVDNAGQSPTSGYGDTATVGSVAGVTTIEFTNTPGVELPMTGGAGTFMYILGGLFMMAVPVVYGFGKRSRRERRAGA